MRTEVSPRYNGKLTFQLTPNDTLIASVQYDNYNVTGRLAFIPATVATDQQTVNQDSPEAIWNVQYRKVFGSNTFLEAKYTGYWGYYYLDPVDPTPGALRRRDGRVLGRRRLLLLRRPRPQPGERRRCRRTPRPHGKHNFKFGMEIERSTVAEPVRLHGRTSTTTTTAARRTWRTATPTTSTARTSASRTTRRTSGRSAA